MLPLPLFSHCDLDLPADFRVLRLSAKTGLFDLGKCEIRQTASRIERKSKKQQRSLSVPQRPKSHDRSAIDLVVYCLMTGHKEKDHGY